MKKTILTLLLAAMSTGAMAEWQILFSNEDGVAYIDPTAIRKDGKFRKAWVLFEWHTQFPNGMKSSRDLMEYNCKEVLLRSLKSETFSGPMASGYVVQIIPPDSQWGEIPPDHGAMKALKYVCAK